MRKLSIIILFLLPFFVFSQSQVVTISTTPQNFTGAWANYGGVQNVQGASSFNLLLKVDINDSTQMRVRILTLHTVDSSDEWERLIYTVDSGNVKVQPEYIEFNFQDANDHDIELFFETNGPTHFIQIQIMAGTVGGTAGQIDAGYIVKK